MALRAASSNSFLGEGAVAVEDTGDSCVDGVEGGSGSSVVVVVVGLVNSNLFPFLS